jgi:hypothetical protein
MRRHRKWFESNPWWYREVRGETDKALIGGIYLENDHVVLYIDAPRKKINLGKIEDFSGIARKLTTHIAKTMLEKNE